MTHAPILIVGATGLLGSRVAALLQQSGRPVRGLVRPDSPRAPVLDGRGVTLCPGDLKDADSIASALRGAGTVVVTANAVSRRAAGDSLKSVDLHGVLRLLEAAERAGVERCVYVSVSPNVRADNPLVRVKRQVESALRAGRLRWSILQPSYFMEIWFSPRVGWDPAGGRVTIYGAGRASVSWISVDDVAAFTAAAALDEAWDRRAVPVGGPEPLSQLEAADRFREALCRDFRFKRVPYWTLRIAGRVLAPFRPIPASLAALGAAISRGDAVDPKTALALQPRRLRLVAEYARQALGS